jgi:Flp pilus assembly protein TadG
MFSVLIRLIRCTSGTAAIEGAIVLPLAISLMAGGVEFGRLVSAYSTADKSMRDAARYLARVPQAGVNGWGLDNAKCLAVFGKMPCNPATDPPLVTGWISLNSVQCSTCADIAAASPPDGVVRLSATVPYAVLMLGAVGLTNSYTLSVQHEERFIGE